MNNDPPQDYKQPVQCPARPNPSAGADPAAAASRERDVFRLHAAFRDIPHIDNLGPHPDTHAFPGDFVARPATDASLAAFAQLAAFRLKATRSMISLIGDRDQYILAEATPDTSLRFDSPLNQTGGILLGNVCIPRQWGICEKVLDPDALAEGNAGIIVIRDLAQSETHASRTYVRDAPHLKFYAGVPLISKTGSIIGSICIFDDTAAHDDGLSPEDILYLQDLSATIVDYLDTYALRDQHRRGAEGLRGLMSFSEGIAYQNTSLEESRPLNSAPDLSPRLSVTTTDEGYRSSEDLREDGPAPILSSIRTDAAPSSLASPQPHLRAPSVSIHDGVLKQQCSVNDLQDSIVPSATRDLFSRAADIMRRANDMDGVLFLDASVVAKTLNAPTAPGTGKKCRILGFALAELSSYEGDLMPVNITPDEACFGWLLQHYPGGYSINIAGPHVISWPEEITANNLFAKEAFEETRLHLPSLDNDQYLTERVKALIPGVKSALFLPLWDTERRRWYSGCFSWSTRTERNLSRVQDLYFLKAFGRSIMQELTRIDAQSTDQVKTTFLSSLSHELRSPLHGILGAIQLMRNTTLDGFQCSMVNSITVCGRTLLETVEHLLDHAERRPPGRTYSAKTSLNGNTVRLAATASNQSAAPTSSCSLGLIVEDVVESMMLGQAPFEVSSHGGSTYSSRVTKGTDDVVMLRRNRFVVVNIGNYADLELSISASSFGRLVMNLVGNAFKFTESGTIEVTLQSDAAESNKRSIKLTIVDSGVGMSNEFLTKNAFEPFQKANQHTAGTGVGLSVVRRILEDVGGEIEITSEIGKGTMVTLNLLLSLSEDKQRDNERLAPLAAAFARLEKRKVCLLHGTPKLDDSPGCVERRSAFKRYTDSLHVVLANVLKMDVTRRSEWDVGDPAELVICPEVSFEKLDAVRAGAAAGRKLPATVFIARDVLEAETVRSDARVTSGESLVDIMTQPCGPYKLAIILASTMHQYDTVSLEPSVAPSSSASSIRTDAPSNSPAPDPALTPRLNFKMPLPLCTTQSVSGSSTPVESTASAPAAHTTATESPAINPSTDPPADIPVPRVLIVDDNAVNRRLLTAFMKKRKRPSLEAKDGLEALNMYKEAQGAFELILMDISMPVMDGTTATRLIRMYETEQSIQLAHIIALTGLTSAAAKLEAWTSGVDDFMTKPVSFGQLGALMEKGRNGESCTVGVEGKDGVVGQSVVEKKERG